MSQCSTIAIINDRAQSKLEASFEFRLFKRMNKKNVRDFSFGILFEQPSAFGKRFVQRNSVTLWLKLPTDYVYVSMQSGKISNQIQFYLYRSTQSSVTFTIYSSFTFQILSINRNHIQNENKQKMESQREKFCLCIRNVYLKSVLIFVVVAFLFRWS